MTRQMTQDEIRAEHEALEPIRNTISAWLERQPSFSYDPLDIAVQGETVARHRWARVWGIEDLAHDENVNAGTVPHVIEFTLSGDGDITNVRQRRYSEQTARAIGRGRDLLDRCGPDIPHQCADAAQDAIVDIMEALEFYGLDAQDALVAARSSWDNDREPAPASWVWTPEDGRAR